MLLIYKTLVLIQTNETSALIDFFENLNDRKCNVSKNLNDELPSA